ncbi:histidinol dehydrogenase-domain-containing protein [Lipomyces tetrasporus]|uniref:Histidine biosynthesis trifunctional protein n=1 Tax=Lipomyces tetrasporus TaxID=54092 RepID=A0AAD7VQ21_9ASCO|nr:histidinol dehydrogenase-domain-containing protein [Lipomyces tetrasporus]KAJ8097436.1 histidinol dehydrogenase-domain-containing protein [Lipomyces tetrasporus]
MTFPLLPLLAPCNIASTPDLSVVGHTLIGPVSTSQDVATVKDYISANFGLVEFSVQVTSAIDIDDIISLLDTGADAVFPETDEQAIALFEIGIPGSRVVFPGEDYDDVKGVYVTSSALTPDLASKLSKSVLADGTGSQKLYVTFSATPTLEQVKKITALPAIPIIPAEALTTDPAATDKLSVAAVFSSALTTDRPDGYFSTVVVDTQGVALGLVYSSEESIAQAIKARAGVYQSRKRGLWFKGATSGAVQTLVRLELDCDGDCVKFVVQQAGKGFCHLDTTTCFGKSGGMPALERTLVSRLENAPAGSYTRRLFSDEKLLSAKIMEEAEELTTAKSKDEIAWEFADLLYFGMTKAVEAGVSWADVERNLDSKAKKITRRKGDAKQKWIDAAKKAAETPEKPAPNTESTSSSAIVNGAVKQADNRESTGRIQLTRVDVSDISESELTELLRRPAQKNANIMNLVGPIVEAVRTRGDVALLEFTAKFEKAKLKSPVLKAPFPPELMELDQETKDAIDLSFENVLKFHAGQLESAPLVVETVPGVVCSRFSRPIESVGLYVPGGTAILPSTALMLGVPALVAGCKNIVFASPPRSDGTLTPEVVYVAHKVGAAAIVLAGGAQAVAAMAYGTESVPKVNKILGPGNQFVTAAKMLVQNDTSALVSIDMPAGPSEVLVVADKKANPAFVASDLLSQAEHGVDSQVILIGVDLNEAELQAIEDEVHEQAMRLPRVEIVRGAIAHSRTFQVKTVEQAIALSNKYAPEHLILQLESASKYVDLVQHAGSVFVGAWSPESCGDYSSGTNHTLPTYGYATVYSGVNTHSFMKHLTSQELTPEGLKKIGGAVVRLATVEGLDAHGNAVRVRLEHLAK